MKAVRYHQYGGPDVLRFEEVPIPEVGPEEVLIKVSATAFNPADAMFRMGLLKDMIPLQLPFTPHADVSGVIEKAGESVKGLKTGDKVFAFLDMTRNGAAAEYVVSKAVDVALAPKNISLQDAGAIPGTATTAWQGIFEHGKLQSGQRLLIVAAAGGVGSFALQFAKWKGAYVIGSDAEETFSKLKELGIDEVINYKTESITDQVTEKVDVILNLSPIDPGDVTKLLPLLKKGGTLVSTLNPADENVAKELGVNAVTMAVQRSAAHLSQIAALVDEGVVKPFISERLPFSNLAAAHEKFGQTHGKVLILVDSSLD
ncbi:MAG: NADP-dependent oxidoreductase [Desulfatitalea sp.]|nr:NADP-dependent oxidoreductase [Desulfatitalea sp.]NNK00470.1 NADP-dependent oxidoreductase [Desulfatitalea sp.]